MNTLRWEPAPYQGRTKTRFVADIYGVGRYNVERVETSGGYRWNAFLMRSPDRGRPVTKPTRVELGQFASEDLAKQGCQSYVVAPLRSNIVSGEHVLVVRIHTSGGLELESYTVDCGNWPPHKVAAEIRGSTETAYTGKSVPYATIGLYSEKTDRAVADPNTYATRGELLQSYPETVVDTLIAGGKVILESAPHQYLKRVD